MLAEANVKNVKEENNCEKSVAIKETVIHQYIGAIISSLQSYMYGNSIGWLSSALPYLNAGEQEGWIGGVFCLAALFVCPFFGFVADAKGRKIGGFIVALCFLINWILIVSSTNIACVLVARMFAGAGGSGSITIVYMYNNEIAAPKLKTVLGGAMALLYSIGILTAYILGAILSYNQVACIYIGVSLVFFPLWWLMPESPAQLLLKKKEKEALKALTWLRGSPEAAIEALESLIQQQAGAAKAASLVSFFKDRTARKAFWLCGVMIAVQSFCGIFAVHSYAGSIFSRAGGALSPTAGTILYGCLMVFGAVIPPLIADRAPRKIVLAGSCFVLAAALGTMAYQMMYPAEDSFIPAIALAVSVSSFVLGLGSVLYVLMAEIFSDENRGVGSSLLVALIWVTCFLLLQFYPTAVHTLGDDVVFFFFAAVCLFGGIFCAVFIPETRGLSRQEIVALLNGEKIDKKMADPPTLTRQTSVVASNAMLVYDQ